MLKRVIIVWAVANFGIVGLASLVAGKWYIAWRLPTTIGTLVEVGLIMIPNLLLPIFALRFWWPEPVPSLRYALAWRWNGWRSIAIGLLFFVLLYILEKTASLFIGESIPYNLPGSSSGGGITIRTPADMLLILGLLLDLLVFELLTVAGEETMFRGWIQTQVGKRYGVWLGLLLTALLFGLRHLPNDWFYAQVWHATPRMWLSRQVQLYLGAVCFGLARYFGKSTFASAITHGLYLIVVLFGLG
jgi:membrane protease YdiL (CAAX protease family)